MARPTNLVGPATNTGTTVPARSSCHRSSGSFSTAFMSSARISRERDRLFLLRVSAGFFRSMAGGSSAKFMIGRFRATFHRPGSTMTCCRGGARAGRRGSSRGARRTLVIMVRGPARRCRDAPRSPTHGGAFKGKFRRDQGAAVRQKYRQELASDQRRERVRARVGRRTFNVGRTRRASRAAARLELALDGVGGCHRAQALTPSL